MTTRAWRTLPFSVSMALPDRMPWVTSARTDLAPFSLSTAAAFTRVPQVSAMSSVVCQLSIYLASTAEALTNENGDLVLDTTDKNLDACQPPSPHFGFKAFKLTMRPTTLGLGRSLWIRAKAVLRWSAIDVALYHVSRSTCLSGSQALTAWRRQHQERQ